MGCAITNAGATPVSVAMIRMQSDGNCQHRGRQHGDGAGGAHDLNSDRRRRADVADGTVPYARATPKSPLTIVLRVEPFDDVDGHCGAEGSA